MENRTANAERFVRDTDMLVVTWDHSDTLPEVQVIIAFRAWCGALDVRPCTAYLLTRVLRWADVPLSSERGYPVFRGVRWGPVGEALARLRLEPSQEVRDAA